MMSMVLGVVGDLFAEATNLDLSDADEVEQIAIQKAYQRIDTESRGKLGWREFKEVMAHLASSTATTAATSGSPATTSTAATKSPAVCVCVCVCVCVTHVIVQAHPLAANSQA